MNETQLNNKDAYVLVTAYINYLIGNGGSEWAGHCLKIGTTPFKSSTLIQACSHVKDPFNEDTFTKKVVLAIELSEILN